MAVREESDLPLQTHHHHHSSSSSSSSSSCFINCFSRIGVIDDNTPITPTRSASSRHLKCPNFICNIRKRRHHSADFRYDPLSYALNFDEGFNEESPVAAGDDMRYRGFSARLPASPPSSRFSSVQPN